MSSASLIHVIVCERDDAGFHQLCSALPDLGMEFKNTLVRNPRELTATLTNEKPDLVICNQNIPDLVIQEVYSQISQHAPKAKLIAVTSEMRPGVLTEAIKNGARDVITRDNLAQLPVVIARELDKLEEYRIRLQTQQPGNQPHTEPNHVHLDDGIVVACGTEITQLVGASNPDELIGTLILDYCDASYLTDVREQMREWGLGQGADKPLELQGITLDNKRIPLTIALIKSDQNHIGQLVLSITRSSDQTQTAPQKTTEPATAQAAKESASQHSDAEAAANSPAKPEPSPATPAPAKPKPDAAPQKASSPAILLPDDNPWVNKLNKAIQNDEFALASQRITALGTDAEPQGNTEHVDILIRMFLRLREQGKEINAGTFISSAKKAGLLPEIDRWVIGHACNLLSQHYGQDRHPLFFLRISPDSLASRELLPWIHTHLKDSGAPPASLSFELPETEIVDNIDNCLPALKQLKDMGCNITMSHFGSTNKSDMLLDSMPVDFVKLHPNDVRAIADNEHSVARVANVTERMHSREVETIAPQVERAAQLAALWQCGVDYAQGYYMKQPEIVLTSSYKQKEPATTE